jgi:hypothetical protein
MSGGGLPLVNGPGDRIAEQWSLAIGVLSFAGVVAANQIAMLRGYRQNRRHIPDLYRPAIKAGILAASIVLTLLSAGLLYVGAPAFLTVASTMPKSGVLGLGASIAIGLYLLRRSALFIYGTVEVVVAIFMLWNLGPARSQPSVWALTAMGAVYVMIRGFTNCEKDAPNVWATLRARIRPKPE